MKRYLIYGAGGHGKVVVNALQLAGLHCDGFIDSRALSSWCNLPVMRETELTQEDFIHIAIGHSPTRQKIASQSQHKKFFSVIHPAAIVAQSTLLSNQGVFVAAGAIIGPDASIDDHSIINHGAVVDHDCKVGKFCHVAPNAVLGGGATIGKNVMVGSGAVILPGLMICDNVTIGAGAVVTKDILTPQTVIGVPAKNIDTI